MKIVVLGGAGDMGSRAVRDLAAQTDVSKLTIADIQEVRAHKLAEELNSPKVSVARVDATDPESLKQAISGHDVAASAIGPFYKFEAPVARAAIEAGVNYVSICDDYDAAAKVLEMDEMARERGLRVLTGLGWTPGMTNVAARKGADQMDETQEINVAWAGSSADSQGYAVVLHTIHIFTGLVPSFRDGKRIEVEAGTAGEVVSFPAPIENVNVCHLGHPEPVTIPRFIKGLKVVTLKGGLTEPLLNKLAIAIARMRLTNTRRKKDAVGRIIKTALPVLEKLGKPGIPISGLRVDVRGLYKGKPRHLVYKAANHMNNLTGVPLAVGALMLGRGQIQRKGVFAPEAEGAVDPALFFAELAERGVFVSEQEL
ncbi:MAG: saccharopine dehydrogenase NADP-binding domain-containing protein [Firmicutes bacterium]|nr:saccharopine dehydrogenase NADP-binding domain-containing protein [Bacillota bacterium]